MSCSLPVCFGWIGKSSHQPIGSKFLQDAVVFIHTQAHVPQDFAQQRSDDYLGAVVRNDHDAPLGIAKGVVASLLPNPVEASRLSHFT
jgi:hypothetical protein